MDLSGNIETVLITLFQAITGGTLIILLRYKQRLPREIFLENYTQGVIYLSVFLVNLIILIFLCKYIYNFVIKITGTKNTILEEINEDLESCYIFMANLFLKIPYSDYLIAYTTHYLIKFHNAVNKTILKIILFLPTITLMICFNYDIFHTQYFHYSYMALYLSLLPLSLKIFLFTHKYRIQNAVNYCNFKYPLYCSSIKPIEFYSNVHGYI